MDEATRPRFEAEVQELCAQGDYTRAATLTIKGYGGELYGFLVTLSPTEADASDAFGDVSEGIWRGLPGFAWECTLRTWSYAIVRNTLRLRARGAARGRRAAHVSDSALAEVAQAVRTETISYLRTERRTRLEALRDSLPEADRTLLVLRIDRKLAWKDLAIVLRDASSDEPPSAAELARESARLRKQFQNAKDRLRALAKRQGLLG